jgi:hypothetical protein
MKLRYPHQLSLLVLLGSLVTASLACQGQQVIQRGAMGKPAQVLDETGQWTEPILLSSDHDVELYIPDISSPAWLDANYQSYIDHDQVVLSMFTFYRTTKACRASQIAWGFSDGSHLDDCIDIGYRVRRATVDMRQKIVTLISASMVDQNGAIIESSSVDQPIVKTWADLDAGTREALIKAAELISKQMKHYDQRINGKR